MRLEVEVQGAVGALAEGGLHTQLVGVGGPGRVGREGGGAWVEGDAHGRVGGVERLVLRRRERVPQLRGVVAGFVVPDDEVEVGFDGEGLRGAGFHFAELLLGAEFAVEGSEGWVGAFGVAEGEVDGSGTTADLHPVGMSPDRSGGKYEGSNGQAKHYDNYVFRGWWKGAGDERANGVGNICYRTRESSISTQEGDDFELQIFADDGHVEGDQQLYIH